MRPELFGDTMSGEVKCPQCRSDCQFLGPSIAIPPKREVAAWRRLRAEVAQFRQDLAAECQKSAVRDRHDLERRISKLKSRPPSSGRARLIKELEKQLSAA